MKEILNGLTVESRRLDEPKYQGASWMELEFKFNGKSLNRLITGGDSPLKMYVPDDWRNYDLLRTGTRLVIEGLKKLKENATLKWLDRMNDIPTIAVTRLAEQGYQTLSGESSSHYCDDLVAWGTMWTFKEELDESWAAEHPEVFEACGFSLFEVEDLGLVFGVDGGGYSFVDEHFIPLYEARGLCWHETWPELERAVERLTAKS